MPARHSSSCDMVYIVATSSSTEVQHVRKYLSRCAAALLLPMLCPVVAYAAPASGSVRVKCRDGTLGASERSGSSVVASAPVCDLDGANNGTCMFVLPTGLKCALCPQDFTYVVPLAGHRTIVKRVDRLGRTSTNADRLPAKVSSGDASEVASSLEQSSGVRPNWPAQPGRWAKGGVQRRGRGVH